MPKPTPVPGLSPDTALSVAEPLIVRARLADVRRQEAAFGDDGGAREPDADAVHDMRVAARRLRAALGVLGDADLVELEDEVKALQDALGAVRDRQVQRAWIESAGSRIDAEGARQLAAWVSQGLDDDLRSLQLALAGWSSSVAPTIFERSCPRERARPLARGRARRPVPRGLPEAPHAGAGAAGPHARRGRGTAAAGQRDGAAAHG